MLGIRIGTLSMEREDYLNLPVAQVRVDVLLNIVRDHAPNLLVCAMDYLASHADLAVLAGRLAALNHATTVVVDCAAQDKGKGTGKTKGKSTLPLHVPPLYLIEPGQQPRILARQLISHSAHKATWSMTALRRQIPMRVFRVGGKRVACLCCGEINFFTCDGATTKVHPFSKPFRDIERHFNAADIVLNPTHDVMTGRPRFVVSKRRHLSRRLPPRKRCYVSVSNWELAKKQAWGMAGLHTVYVNGTDRLTANHRVNLGRTDFAYSQITV